MSRVLLQQYSFKSTLVRVYLLPATLTVTSANACGLPFDLMEAADGPSNKSRLLGKEPIAWEGRNKSQAVLHCGSGYLLWQGVVSLLGRVVVVVVGDSDRCIAPPSFSHPSFPLSPAFFPAWFHTGQVADIFSTAKIHLRTAVLCDLGKPHKLSVLHAD